MDNSESPITNCVLLDDSDMICDDTDKDAVENSDSPVTGCVTPDTRDLFFRDAEIRMWGNPSLQMLTVAR